jgi:LuxR family maltose regulon positive regulatory protein
MKQPLLQRAQIGTQLKEVFNYPLLLVVAAMGYGKTTSVKSFLDEVKAQYIWLSVESDESSSQYIWDSLTRQLAKTEPELGNQLNTLGFPIDAPQRNRVIAIIAEYAFISETILVIDDYHFAHSPELDRLLERIVRSDISGLHILILSRTKPELNIDELQLKGYCFLFDSDLFVLSATEIQEYFQLFGREITAATAAEVYAISEGWITAVYLIIQRYCEIGRLEPGGNIESLIETAVMSRYSAEETRLLMLLCSLDSFTPQQALYVTGAAAAARIMQRLSANNSLIRYDEWAGTYKMHRIFSDYLKKRQEEWSDGLELQQLWRRSGEWYLKNGDPLSGLKFLLRAGEYDLIMAEFEKPGLTKLLDRNPVAMMELFEQIPTAVKYNHPFAFLTYAEFYLNNVNMENGAELLAQIEQYYGDDTAKSSALQRRIAGEIELIKSFMFFNDLRKMHQYQLSAYQLLDGISSIANQDMIFTFGSPHTLYLYYRERGELRWIVDYADQVFHYYCEVSHGCGTGFEYLVGAEYYLETGDLAQAGTYARKAIYKASTKAQFSIIICVNLTLARLHLAQGRFAEAMEVMDDLSIGVAEQNSPILNSAVDLCAGYIGAILNEPQSIAGWLKSGDMSHSELLYQGMAFNYIVHAKAVLLAGDYLKLEVLCEEMLGLYSRFNNLLGFLHVHILDTAAKYKLYGIEKARAAIEPALAIGRADNIILPFAEYGMYILDILKSLQKESGGDPYLDRLVTEAARYRANLKLLEGKSTAEVPLTQREREILQLVVEGQTSREIAAGLYLAEITVKKNISSIYRKLKVEGRAAAVKKTLELKLI